LTEISNSPNTGSTSAKAGVSLAHPPTNPEEKIDAPPDARPPAVAVEVRELGERVDPSRGTCDVRRRLFAMRAGIDVGIELDGRHAEPTARRWPFSARTEIAHTQSEASRAHPPRLEVGQPDRVADVAEPHHDLVAVGLGTRVPAGHRIALTADAQR